MVREYAPADLEAALEVFHRAVHEGAARDYTPAQRAAWAPEPDREAWARRLSSGGVFIAERESKVLGFARVEDNGCVDLLYVHPEAMRQGVGGALMVRILDWAAQRGIGRLHAQVSLTARAFFEGAGFRTVAEQTVERRGVSLRNLRMERAL